MNKNHFRSVSVAVTVLLIVVSFYIRPVFGAKEGSHDFFNDETRVAVDSLGREEGLSNLSVSHIIQDKYGFMWFGTQGGLNRYDGRTVKAYRHNPFDENQLPHNLIQTMYYDEVSNDLWIGTYNGVSHFDIETETFTNYLPKTEETEGVSNPVIIAIEQDSNGHMWFGTGKGLDRLDPDNGQIVNYEIEGNVVRSLQRSKAGDLLIGTLAGLFRHDPDSDAFEKIEHEQLVDPVMFIKETNQGRMLIGNWGGGVSEFDEDMNLLRHYDFGKNEIYSAEITEDGTLWIGTWNDGLHVIQSNGERRHLSASSESPGISHNVVYSLLEDDSGILWVGTNGGGINILNPRKRDYVRFSYSPEVPESLDKGKINVIYKDDNGDFWIAVYNSGVNRFNSQGELIEKYYHDDSVKGSIIGNQVMAIDRDEEGRLIFATEFGLCVYDEYNDTFDEWGILPNRNMVYDFVQNGDVYYIGTYEEGLMRYEDESLTSVEISDDKVFSLLLDSKDHLWIGTNDGLNVLDLKTDEVRSYHSDGTRDQLPGDAVEYIYEDSTGRIWIATASGGVAHYVEASDTFETLSENEGLSSNNTLSIIECFHGAIWIATLDGISILYPDTDEIIKLGPEDGIGGWEFSRGVYRDEDGNVYFGGIHGVTMIPDSHMNSMSDVKPMVYLTEVSVYDQTLENGFNIYNDRHMTFEAGDNFIRFDFVALEYGGEENISYMYRIEGLDGQWHDLGEQSYLSFANLPAGNYTLTVRASGLNSTMSDEVKVTFSKQQYWYLRWYIFIVYGLLLIVIGYIVNRLRSIRKIKEKNRELDELNGRLEDANDQLEALSTTDALTGLGNRRFLDLKLDELIHLGIRSKTSIAMMIIDVDWFKKINDNYGHLLGDAYLVEVGKVLNNVIRRSTDIAVRYGGDEFILVLYDDTVDGAMMLANRILEEVSEISIGSEYALEGRNITASIGLVSLVPSAGCTAEDIIHAADEALYQAKERGRNQICIGRHKRYGSDHGEDEASVNNLNEVAGGNEDER